MSAVYYTWNTIEIVAISNHNSIQCCIYLNLVHFVQRETLHLFAPMVTAPPALSPAGWTAHLQIILTHAALSFLIRHHLFTMSTRGDPLITKCIYLWHDLWQCEKWRRKNNLSALTQSQFSISLIYFSISKPSLREIFSLHPTHNYFFSFPSFPFSCKLYLFHCHDSFFVFKLPLVLTDVYRRHLSLWFTLLWASFLREKMLSLNCDLHTLQYRCSLTLMTS